MRFGLGFGLCLGRVSCLPSKLFIGRESDLEEIKHSESNRLSQKLHRIILTGVRGVGKTQLAIQYAKRSSDVHDSCFWLNAASESTLRKSIEDMAWIIFEPQYLRNINEEELVILVHNWLSDGRNTRWLMIFDGYKGVEQFNIENFFPPASHGTLIVTTKMPCHISGQGLQIDLLQNTKDCLDIVQTRSGREDIQHEPSANSLIGQLGGLPLDLAIAGLYLKSVPTTLAEYVQARKERPHFDSRRPIRPPEYEE